MNFILSIINFVWHTIMVYIIPYIIMIGISIFIIGWICIGINKLRRQRENSKRQTIEILEDLYKEVASNGEND